MRSELQKTFDGHTTGFADIKQSEIGNESVLEHGISKGKGQKAILLLKEIHRVLIAFIVVPYLEIGCLSGILLAQDMPNNLSIHCEISTAPTSAIISDHCTSPSDVDIKFSDSGSVIVIGDFPLEYEIAKDKDFELVNLFLKIIHDSIGNCKVDKCSPLARTAMAYFYREISNGNFLTSGEAKPMFIDLLKNMGMDVVILRNESWCAVGSIDVNELARANPALGEVYSLDLYIYRQGCESWLK